MGTSKGYIPPKNEQWRQAKGAVTRMMKNSRSSVGISKAISKYADAYMSTHLGKSNISVVAGGFMNFINAANKYGAENAAKDIGLDSLLDKKGDDLYKGLIDYFARDFSTMDMQIIRESLSETLKRIEIETFKDFEQINSEEFLIEFIIQFAIKNFETCFAEKIFTNSELSKDYDRVMDDVGSAIENRIVADIQLEKKLDLDYTSKEGQEYILSVCKDCYGDLKKWRDCMKIWINKATEETPNIDFEEAIRFDMLDEGPKSNLKVNFEEIWRRFNRELLENIYEDLITVAASVYAADKRVPRVGVWAGEVEDNWTREIHISIPVLELKKWSKVKTKLEDILSFLSGDIWIVSFRKTTLKFRNYVTKKKYDIIEGKFDAVSLFSGGLDSYSGAINLLEKDKNICFVGCREYNALGKRIFELYRILKENYPGCNVDMVLFNTDPRIPYNIDEDLKTKYIENTSRSRSFLFLSVALAVASQIGENIPVYIPENGFIGLNLPLTPSRRGSCSTRTTHVYFINALNNLLQILEIPHRVENFFAYKTKGEIVHSVKMTEAFKMGAGKTISCSHPMRADKGIKGRPRSCGYCYPCLIRRASLIGIDISEEYLEKFKEDYKIGMAFVKNKRFSNPDTGKTTDLKAVLFKVWQ